MHVLYAGEEYKGRNSITAQILGVLAFFVDYGAFTNRNEIQSILNVLIQILDGRTDEYLPGNN